MKFTKVICFAISVLFLQSLEALADWDVDNSKKSVTASITGNITHGERQRFYFSKSNCDVVQHIFSAYTTKTADFEKLEGKVLAIEFNGDKIGTRLIAAKKAMLGHLLMFGLGTYDRDFIVKLIKKNELITITFVDGNGHKASDYFDIPSNNWSAADALEAIEVAHSKCVQ